MSSPTIPDLPSATTADDADLLLMRQPGTALGVDKQVTVAKIRQLNLSGLAPVPNTPQASDLFLIQQSGANWQIRFDQISVPSGTKMWFYHNAASDVPGWSLFASGDTLLAVKGGSTYTTGGTQAGNWQQSDHTLTVNEIPPHTHTTPAGKESSGSSGIRFARRATDFDNLSTIISSSTGGGNPHNHGNSWRPRASVGVILQKN